MLQNYGAPTKQSYNPLMARKVLVVDDTKNIQLMLKEYLQNQGFEVLLAYDGLDGLRLFTQENPDLILLDIMMPNMDGYQLISKLRAESGVPVIMITAKQQEADVIRGFELGADDYITKPFRLRELLMRIRAVMRRAAPAEGVEPVLRVSDISLDTGKHEVRKGDTLVETTPLEFQLLKMLMESAGRVVKRQDMSLRLLDYGFSGSESTLKIHIRNVRQKLGDDISEPRYIETVFGIGYRFLEDAG
ncbi:MAG: response regulator transcription factor [Anaerolineaceae bacterium]|jgi:DNA-binding response OmpR family regulator|nr:response regulator transcription factor [Anaerolineaceae bacterium]HPT24636.1 response regulator transcription factor [Anaerolineaceae bacterium]